MKIYHKAALDAFEQEEDGHEDPVVKDDTSAEQVKKRLREISEAEQEHVVYLIVKCLSESMHPRSVVQDGASRMY